DHVVVVGAGLGGLSAALRLAGAGRSVTLLEREDVPGGRAGLLVDRGYSFDTGPTVLTMPDLVADALDCVGESMDDWLELLPVTPAYRARFADGSSLDVHASVEAMADEVARVCGAREADGYRRLVAFVSELYRLEMRDFIDRNVDSPLSLLRPSLARLVAHGGLRRLAPTVGQFLRDDRTRRVFSFQAMYAGLSPYDALALYAVIGYMDAVAGVFFPRGGMHAVPRALAGAAEKHGVVVRYGETVQRVELRGRRAVAVVTAGGDRVPCDAVVLNPDLPAARRLVGAEVRRKLTYSPSCFLMLAGSRSVSDEDAHHTISFGRAWRSVFDELLGGRLMSDPSFLVSSPSDPSLAPPGRSSYTVLFPTPNLDAPVDWTVEGPRYRAQVLATLEARGWPGFADGLEVEHTTTPLDWAARGMERGTPFAAAHTFRQTGPFRPGNLWGENVVFAGSGTRPGVGVPMVLLSGRLAAERILGPDPSYRSRAWL
ncbi:MAG: phytoene desaturase family protein, partial [Actinomycetes bacterium]